jgi:hypothetical protein
MCMEARGSTDTRELYIGILPPSKKKKVILASKKLTTFNFDQIYLTKY